jgi:CheY-like chemotaxis protein
MLVLIPTTRVPLHPLWSAGEDDEGMSRTPLPSLNPVGRAPNELRVLIVEDEAFVRLDLELALTSAGYAVIGSAVSADDAVSKAENERPDLVLMDIRLVGDRDGIDAALEIRRRFDIPSLFITAFANQRMQERAAPARPVGFFQKPIDAASLLGALKKLLK